MKLQSLTDKMYCRLGVSKIHGVGVFAVVSIPKGINPFKVSKKYEDMPWLDIPNGFFKKLPKGRQRLIAEVFIPSKGVRSLPSCGTNIVFLDSYLNHSEKPNMATKNGFSFYTLRHIRTGEELTVDYRTYVENIKRHLK